MVLHGLGEEPSSEFPFFFFDLEENVTVSLVLSMG